MQGAVATLAKQRPDETRSRLLWAAERILIEHGVHALTVRRIGAVSALNATLVTYHFGTVAKLLSELARSNLEPMLAAWRRLPAPGAAASVPEVLDIWLRPLLAPAAFNPAGRALIVLDEIAAHGTPELSGEVMDPMREVGEKVRAALAPLLPALDATTLRARLRFIAGAALGPPPRTGRMTLSDAQGRDLAGIEELEAFARAALTG